MYREPIRIDLRMYVCLGVYTFAYVCVYFYDLLAVCFVGLYVFVCASGHGFINVSVYPRVLHGNS